MDLKFHFPAILKKLKRGPAIIHPKDAGLIIAHLPGVCTSKTLKPGIEVPVNVKLEGLERKRASTARR